MDNTASHTKRRRSPLAARLALGTLLSCCLFGCEAAGWLASSTQDLVNPRVILAEYNGLAGQRTAILVDAPPDVLLEQPSARSEIAGVIASKLSATVENLQLADPAKVESFILRQHYWHTLPYSRILAELGVDRLLLVDLTDYRLHEAGNEHVWRGQIAANLGVAAADAASPNDLVYDSTVSATYPPDAPLGLLNADPRRLRMQTINHFADAVAKRFHDHREERTQ